MLIIILIINYIDDDISIRSNLVISLITQFFGFIDCFIKGYAVSNDHG